MDLCMFFIDLGKGKKNPCDMVPRQVKWWVLEIKQASSMYIDMIKDIYDVTITRMRIIKWET